MTDTINGRTPEEITYNCMMYRLKRPNEWYEHCAGSLTLKGRVETAKWAYNYIQQLEDHFRDLTKKVEQLERERDAAVDETESLRAEIDAINEDYLRGIHTVREDAQPKWISVEDELPPVGERVLALNGHSVFESFIDCQDVWHRSPTCYELKGNVTHWMPLPSTEGLE